MHFTVHEAKTHFSKLLAHVQAGEEVIITTGTDRKEIAKLVKVESPASLRLGFAPEWPAISEGFWEDLPEDELALWNGGGE